MKNNWKILVGVLCALLCTVIVCITINVTVKQAAKITAEVGTTSDNAENYNSANGTVPAGEVVIKNPGINGGEVNADVNGGTLTEQNGATVSGGNSSNAIQSGGNTATQNTNNAANPLNFNKAQLAAYYNQCLRKSYSQSKMTATKTEHVNVSVSGIDIGSLNLDVDKFAQDIISSNTKNNDKPTTKVFTNGKASDNSTPAAFVSPANLYADAAKSITIAKSGSGYTMKITLNSESCSHTGTAKYNASCSMPLDIGVIDFGAAVTINKCTFNYPGTQLTATIDSQGRVTKLVTHMPLNIADAEGKALGVTIKVGSIKGTWDCTSTMSF